MLTRCAWNSYHHIFVHLLTLTPLNGTSIISVHRVFLINLLAVQDKLYSGAIQITDCIVLYYQLL